MPKPNAPQLRALVRLHWGRLPMPEVLRRAQELDPDATREQLIGLAARLRRAGELGEDQAYIPRGRTKFWTLEEEAELRELAGKQSLADLAEHFGVSEVSLRKKASNLGVSIAYVRRPTLPLTAEELALAEELVELVAGAPLRRAWRLEGARVAKAGERMAGESATPSGRRELRYADSRIRIDRRAEPGSSAPVDGASATSAGGLGNDQTPHDVDGLPLPPCCHTFRAAGITTQLQIRGTIEHAQQIANHQSPRTTKLCDRTSDAISLDEIERILV